MCTCAHLWILRRLWWRNLWSTCAANYRSIMLVNSFLLWLLRWIPSTTLNRPRHNGALSCVESSRLWGRESLHATISARWIRRWSHVTNDTKASRMVYMHRVREEAKVKVMADWKMGCTSIGDLFFSSAPMFIFFCFLDNDVFFVGLRIEGMLNPLPETSWNDNIRMETQDSAQ